MTQRVARRVKSKFVLHGLIVGLTAFAVYMIPMVLGGGAQPAIYWVAHAMKITGGLAGGYVASRRRAGRPALV